MKIKYQLLLYILLLPVVSWGQKVLYVQSPDRKIELQVMIGQELEIAIIRNGTTVLQPLVLDVFTEATERFNRQKGRICLC